MSTTFTLEDIEKAQEVAPDGVTDYLGELRRLGVACCISHIADGHSDYVDDAGNALSSPPLHDPVPVSGCVDPQAAKMALGRHGRGETDYLTFARQLAAAGVATWVMDPGERTCTFRCRAGRKLFSAPL